ncbi:MAG: cell division protein FtsZ [Patescibacteria group bacterium]|nr:cell division protein FtsZ [Patescibacteria group bacterium]
MAEIKPAIESFAKIKVIGVGGSGGSAINRMIKSRIKGVEFIAANTDVQALHNSHAQKKIQLGKSITRGLGSGMNPDIGKQSAEESQNELREVLNGADMVFVTCGLGGGTGSGASPVIADIARDCGALTVAVVTKPFTFEGVQRNEIADNAFKDLSEQVDTIINIPNDRVLNVIDKKTSLLDAFEAVDDVLRQGVQSISEVITVPGLVNVDFADVKSIMQNTGSALMGIGTATGENRVVTAAKQAISSPLLEMSIEGAKGVLFTITGGSDLGMQEFDEAAKVITSNADSNAKVIFGTVIDDEMKDEVKVCVIATGFDAVHRKTEQKVETSRSASSGGVDFAKGEKSSPSTKPSFFSKALKDSITVRDRDGAKGEDVAPAFSKKKIADLEEVKKPKRQMAGADSEDDLEIPAFIRRKLP